MGVATSIYRYRLLSKQVQITILVYIPIGIIVMANWALNEISENLAI